MKRVVFMMCFTLITAFCWGQSQGEMSNGAAQRYQQADKALNTTYQKILKEYKEDTAFIRNLKNAQRAWIQFRDAEMKAMYPDRKPGYYGSVQPMCWYNYKARLTEEREAKLKIWLEGIPEGDVCAGSVKTKN